MGKNAIAPQNIVSAFTNSQLVKKGYKERSKGCSRMLCSLESARIPPYLAKFSGPGRAVLVRVFFAVRSIQCAGPKPSTSRDVSLLEELLQLTLS